MKPKTEDKETNHENLPGEIVKEDKEGFQEVLKKHKTLIKVGDVLIPIAN